ncbi:glutathione binding-like protein (plasmid) [Nitrobacteraceae bacterium UC4446_H13]
MKLYYATGACSLAAIIAGEEVGLQLDLIRVDIRASPHTLEDGTDFRSVNPKGYVPALQLDSGEILTEGAAILQYLNDRGSLNAGGSAEKPMHAYRLQEWLTFIATELHKSFSPWLFHPEYGEQAAAVARARIAERFDLLELHFASGGHTISGSREYLMGDEFGVADAYCFAIVRWSPGKGIDLASWPNLSAYIERVASRPKVAAAVNRHG